MTKLPNKTEQVLFCQISDRQKNIYLDILKSDEVKGIIENKKMSFRAINILRKLCNHPILVYRNNQILWDKNSDDIDSNKEDTDFIDNKIFHKLLLQNILKWEDSGKLLVISKILPLWRNEGIIITIKIKKPFK